MKDFLGIIGGIGPLASSYFYELIINKTKVKKDQDHIDMVIFNHATIPDRTKYILKQSAENPFEYLESDILTLTKLGAKMIAIPCNTACYFHSDLQKLTNVPVLNLIEDTVFYLVEKNVKKIVILATTGTIKSKLYQNICDKYGIEYMILNEEKQNKVMHIIYDNIKSGKKINLEYWKDIINCDYGTDYFLLGCTELSILKKELKLDSKFIDPLQIEAEKIIKFFGKGLNKE